MAISPNAKWLFENKLFRPTTLLTTNVSMNLPLANLKTQQRQRVAQFNALNDVRIQIDLGEASDVSAVAWVGTNLSAGASVAILRSASSSYVTATLVEDVTQTRPTLATGGMPYEYVNFSLFDPLSFRHWWIVLNDGSNPAGYLRMGALFIGRSYEMAANFNDSISVGVIEDGRTEYGASGTPHTDSRPPARTVSVDFSGISNAGVWDAALYDKVLQIGTSRDFWFIPFPLATGAEKNALALYGRFTALPRIQGDGPTTWAPGGITIRESL